VKPPVLFLPQQNAPAEEERGKKPEPSTTEGKTKDEEEPPLLCVSIMKGQEGENHRNKTDSTEGNEEEDAQCEAECARSVHGLGSREVLTEDTA
jgi:hypothetical protein